MTQKSHELSLLAILLTLTGCATTTFTLVPTAPVHSYGEAFKNSAVFATNEVQVVIALDEVPGEVAVSATVYNRSPNTLSVGPENFKLAFSDDLTTWHAAAQTQLLVSPPMAPEDELKILQNQYNNLAVEKQLLPEQQFKEKQQRLATRMQQLQQPDENAKPQPELKSPVDVSSGGRLAKELRCALQNSKYIRVSYVAKGRDPVDFVYAMIQ